MNLKELQVYGFKSFSDKISLKFENNITGIVGPNGCGKSNVVDAVRWVLGEQSAKGLRGKSMHDLIFSGTEQRKSMSYCEVTMTLDNSQRFFSLDMDEVTISRKLYRSNESEYLLNKQPARLKDITDLLREAGLGKEGYSIVGQGRMDAILNVRPEDRRAIFEEALGISKFRYKKIETERKLEKTRENVLRLYDILSELERRLLPLEKQAEAARKHIALQEELKYHEINSYIYSYDNASENKQKVKEAIKEIDKLFAEAKERYDEAAKVYNKLFAEMSDTDSISSSLVNQQLTLSVQIERYSGEIKLLNERVKNTLYASKSLNKEIEELGIIIGNADKNIKSAVELIVKLKDEEKQQQNCLSELNSRHFDFLDGLTLLQEKLDVKQKEVYAASDRLSAQKNKGALAEGEQRGLINRQNNIKRELEEQNAKLSALVGSQSQELEKLLDSNFEQTTTQEMANQIDGYLSGVDKALSIMSLEGALKSRLNEMLKNISVKCKSELRQKSAAAENWQQNIILMSLLNERMGKFAALQESRQEQIIKLEKDISQLDGRVKALEQTVLLNKQEEQKLEKEKLTAQNSANEVQREYAAAKAKKDKIQEEINACRIKSMGLMSNIQSGEARLSSLKQTVSRSNMEISQKTRQIETNELHLKDLYQQIEQTGGNAEEAALLNEVSEKLKDIQKLRKDIQTRLTEADHNRQFYNAEVQQCSDKKVKEEFNLERIDDDIAAMQQRIEEQYGLTYSSAIRFKDEKYDIISSKEIANKLRSQIARLGFINENAIEDYTNTRARYDEIKTQIDDLKKAEADLNKFLKNITREITVRFNDGFEIINLNFGSVFKELFAGGYARLSIEREEGKDELDFGVEIEAQPPGKRLQNISLLSGGERSLTSVAILFAILKLRPMPFCVLDEIEAALDDANAQRIANYIKKFSNETQFIVATHKKPTMEVCDVLYGVTMEEKGVSKVVSVQLTDIGEEAQVG